MRSNKADKNGSDVKKDHNDKPVFIPFDIEDKPVIPNIINRIEGFQNLLQVIPIGSFYDLIPFIKCINSIRMILPKVPKNGFANDHHSIYKCINKVTLFEILFSK